MARSIEVGSTHGKRPHVEDSSHVTLSDVIKGKSVPLESATVRVREMQVVAFEDPTRKDVQEHLQRSRELETHLVQSWHAGEPIAVGVSRVGGEDVSLTVRGKSLVGNERATGEDWVLASPLGAKGKEVSAQDVEASLRTLPAWTTIAISHQPITDASLKEQISKLSDSMTGIRLDERLVPFYSGDFSVEFHADPLSKEEIGKLKQEAIRRSEKVSGFTDTDPEAEKAKQQEDLRIGDLTDAENGRGYWNLRLVVGAKTSDEARRVASLVAAAANMSQPAYIFTPEREVVSREKVLARKGSEIGTAVLGSLTNSYPTDVEIDGVSLVKHAIFTVNYQGKKPEGVPPLPMGTIQKPLGESGKQLTLTMNHLLGNVLAVGESGSTKSTAIQHILTKYSEDPDARWTVIDPNSSEYAHVLAGRLDAMEHLSPEERDVVLVDLTDKEHPVFLDIFRPLPNCSYKQHAEKLQMILANAVGGGITGSGNEADEKKGIVWKYCNQAFFGADVVLEDGTTQYIPGIYEDAGIDLELDEECVAEDGRPLPKMSDLKAKMQVFIKAQGYGGEVESNVGAIVNSEIEGMTAGSVGEVLEGGRGYPVEKEKFYGNKCVVYLNGIKAPGARSLLLGVFAAEQDELATRRGDTKKVAHITVLEEFQDFLKSEDPTANAIGEGFRKLRKKGEVQIGAAQNITKVPVEVAGSAALKLAGRSTEGDNLERVQKSMKLTDPQVDHMATFTEGEFGIFSRDMHGVMRVKFPHPNSYASTEQAPASSERVVNLGLDEKMYDRTTIVKAERALDKTLVGREITKWVELAVPAALCKFGQENDGDRSIRPSEEYLAAMAGLDADIRDRAINKAVERAVDARSNLIPNPESSLMPIKQQVAANLRAVARGETPPPIDSQFAFFDTDPASSSFQGDTAMFSVAYDRRSLVVDSLVGGSLEAMASQGHAQQWLGGLYSNVLDHFTMSESVRDVIFGGFSRIAAKLHTVNVTRGRESEGRTTQLRRMVDEGEEAA
jgi:hypothetical protein